MLPEKLQRMDDNADQMIKALSEPASDPKLSLVANDQAAAEPPTGAEPTDAGADSSTVPAAQPVPDLSADIKALKQEVFNANQRWGTLQGMLDKKDQELESTRALLAQVSSAQSHEPSAPKKHLTQADEEQFGAELTGAMVRAAMDVVESRLASFTEEVINPLVAQMQGVQHVATATAGTSFEDRLASKVPDWKKVNVDQGFLAWLQGTVPYTRMTKLQALQDAYKAMDLEQTAGVFLAYQDSLTPPSAAPVAPVAPNPAAFSAPGRPKAATPAAEQSAPKIWTAKDITRLYRDYERGALSEAKFLERERDLFKAQEEGRISA